MANEENQTVNLNAEPEAVPLIVEYPNAVMFGYIECKIQSIQLLANGSLKIDYFSCPSNPRVIHYHLLIPPVDVFDWLYCPSFKFSTIFFRLKKDSVVKLKHSLSLMKGFGFDIETGNRYVIFALNAPLDEIRYKQFTDILAVNDVRLGRIGESEARFRFECAKQKKNFETNMLSLVNEFQSNHFESDLSFTNFLKQAIEDLESPQGLTNSSKFSTEPKTVCFGTYECDIKTIDINVFESLQFNEVKQNCEHQSKQMVVKIPFDNIEIMKICRDKQMPAIFLKLTTVAAKVIARGLLLKSSSINGCVFDITSKLETEKYVKVVFIDYIAFNLITGSLKAISQYFMNLEIEEISNLDAFQLLNSKDVIQIRQEMLKSQLNRFNSSD